MEEPKKNMQDEVSLNLFKSISDFVSSLNDCFGPKQKSLQLYARLVSKTTISDIGPMKKHAEAFNKFCTANKEAIMSQNNNLVETNISYNEKVFINMDLIMKNASRAEKKIIWKHLLAIYAHLDPTSKAKEILRESMNTGNGGKEEEFIHNIFDQVGNNIQPEGNPLQAVGSLMSSGVFTDIVQNMSSGLESGELDIGKLMGTMQGMVGSISEMAAKEQGEDAPPEMAQMLNQMNTMMSSLNTQVGDINQEQNASRNTNMNTNNSLAGSVVETVREDLGANNVEEVHVNIIDMMPQDPVEKNIEDNAERFEIVDDEQNEKRTRRRKPKKNNTKVKPPEIPVIDDVD